MIRSFLSSATVYLGRKKVSTTCFETLISEISLISASRQPEQLQCEHSPATNSESSYELETQSKSHAIGNGCSRTLCRILVTGFALWGCFTLIFPSSIFRTSVSDRIIGECDCGDSIAEARLNGCKWDALASAWLPQKCRDDELTAEFEKRGPDGAWKYYANHQGTILLSQTEVSLLADQLDNKYWGTLEWHLVHCVFYWKKTHRTRFTRRHIELRFDNITHIEHCEGILLNRDAAVDETLIAQYAELRSDGYPPR